MTPCETTAFIAVAEEGRIEASLFASRFGMLTFLRLFIENKVKLMKKNRKEYVVVGSECPGVEE